MNPSPPLISLQVTRRRALLLILVALSTQCVEEKLIENPIVVSMPELALGVECMGEPGADTFIFDILTYEGTLETGPGEAIGCKRCLSDPEANCTLIRRECICSGYRVTAEQAMEVFEGFRARNVTAGLPICLRVMMVDRGDGSGPTEGPGESCGEDVAQCRLDWVPEAGNEVKACALSPTYELGEQPNAFVLNRFACWRFTELTNKIRDIVQGTPELYEPLCLEDREVDLSIICDDEPDDEAFNIQNCPTLGQ